MIAKTRKSKQKVKRLLLASIQLCAVRVILLLVHSMYSTKLVCPNVSCVIKIFPSLAGSWSKGILSSVADDKQRIARQF